LTASYPDTRLYLAFLLFNIENVILNLHSLFLAVLLVAAAGGLAPVDASVPVSAYGIERLPDGNTLIADGGDASALSARALEVDSRGRLVWAYVKCDVAFLHTARRLANGNTLMAASIGNRVVEVSRQGDTVWTMTTGLAYPNDAHRLANGNTLITDRDNNRVIEVTPQRAIVWSYANLTGPHNGNRLPNGNTLICDSKDDRVVEIDSRGNIVWQYATSLSWPRSAERLANGNTLITDTGHNRIIEVDESGAIVWSAVGLVLPFAAVRLENGNTLVSTGSGVQLGKVTELSPAGNAVWQYPNTVPVVVETLQVVNPSSGCSLYVHIHRPAYAGPGDRVPGVVLVPGGTGYGSSYDTTSLLEDIASDGFAVLHFDPDGRGRSSAYPENYGGYVQQDGMHACLSLLASRDYVDTSRLGVYTRGYGITMGSGVIARYPEPRVKFLLDFEGPADRSQTCQDSGGFVPVPADSEAFWREREAARFMKQVPAEYLRIQTAVDHNSEISDNRHCIQLIDSATAVAYGGAGISVWTRVNDSLMNPSNRVFSLSSLLGLPTWIPETQSAQNFLRVLLYLHELADKDLAGVAEGRGVGAAVSLRAFPRPCRGALQVGLPPGNGKRDIRVHDVCGRLVARAVVPAGSLRTELDLSDLQPGVYYLSAARAGTVPVVVVR
jgi:hypothetical protein